MNSTLSPSQNKALGKIVRIARENTLHADHIRTAMESPIDANAKPMSGNFLTSLLGYLGGALILSGLLIYTNMIWDDIASLPRVILSLGSGILAFVIGAFLQKDDQAHKASLPLWIVSALFIPTGIFVFLHEYAKGDDMILGGVLAFGLSTLIYLIGFLQFRRSALLFFTLCFGVAFAGTYYEHLDINIPEMWLISGLSMFAIAYRIHQSAYAQISALPFIMAGIMVTASSYYFLGNTVLEGVMAALLLAMIFASYIIRSRGLLIFSTITFIILVSKYHGFCWGYLDNTSFKLTAAITGISMMLTAHWIKENTPSRLAPWWNFFGSSLMFSSFMGLVYETPLDILFPAVPAFVLYVSMKLQSRALLLSSILALLSFISYYSVEYFTNVVGWPIALMIAGMALIGLCAFALKMNKRMKLGPVNV